MTSADDQSRAGHTQRPPIYRVRTGCLTCRGRKKKCDEGKPTCTGCKRNKLQCEWPTTTRNKKRKLPRYKKPLPTEPRGSASDDAEFENQLSQQETVYHDHAGPAPTTAVDTSVDVLPDEPLAEIHVASHDDTQVSEPSSVEPDLSSAQPLRQNSSRSSLEGTSSVACSSADDYDGIPHSDWSSGILDLTIDAPIEIPAEEQQERHVIVPSLVSGQISFAFGSHCASNNFIPRSPSLLPEREAPTYELLGHYLSRTALSMGNGSTDINPFISQLIPLSFANKFILDLVLCQSAVHRATEDVAHLTVAQKYYNNSLRLFRESIDEYILGQEMSPLWIALGALIMCFTETAKGDVHGILFDHMDAAGPLLSNLISQPKIMPQGLKDFIVEYYIDVVTISMISIDSAFGTAPLLGPRVELLGESMVENGYIGHLCGCWLELLLLIPRIFEFGKRSAARDSDDFLTFSTLQRRILSFNPSVALRNDVALCGHIFKQAAHIYLLTALNVAQSPQGQAKQLVEDSVVQAFACLRQLPSNARINTSLCWALAVIGSSVEDDLRQIELRDRLRIMFLAIGLGNIRATSDLLDKMWSLPIHERSPWTICKVMRDNEMWISFV